MSKKVFSFTDRLGRQFAMRSPLEISIAKKIDQRQDLRWNFEALQIPVALDLQAKVGARYLVPDFQLYFPCGEKWVVEGKGVTLLDDYLKRKNTVVREYCEANGFNYEIVLSMPTAETVDEWDRLVNIKGYACVRDWFPRTVQERIDCNMEDWAKELTEEIGRAVYDFDW